MRYAKALVLAAIAAGVMTAVIGAGVASANVLCTENLKTCSVSHKETGKRYDVGDVITGTATEALLTANPNVTCEHSQVSIKITSAGGAGSNVKGDVTSLTFGECHTEGESNCTVTSVGTPYKAEVTGSGTKGALVVKNGAARVVCFGFVDCTFGKASLTLGITGGNPAIVNASNEELEIEAGGFLCPEEAFWHAEYKSTTPVWVVAE